MSPTATAVLWNVLVTRHCAVVDAVLVPPVESVRHIFILDVSAGGWREEGGGTSRVGAW